MWIAVLSGLFVIAGVVVGGVAQIEASKRALLREQQLRAATEMHAAGVNFLTSMERRARALGLDDVRTLSKAEKLAWLQASRGTADEAREDARQLMEKLARVLLVFGDASPSAVAATEAVGEAHRLVAILADEGEDRSDEFTEAWSAAVMRLEEFSRAAHKVFSGAIWRRANSGS